MQMQMEGLDITAKLAKMENAAVGKGLIKGLRAAGQVIKAEVVLQAPVRVDGPSGTALPVGALKADIKSAARLVDSNGDSSVTVGPGSKTQHAAHWVEYGHRMVRGKKRGGKQKLLGKGYVPAHPFIRPAYEATITSSVEAFSAALFEAVQEE